MPFSSALGAKILSRQTDFGWNTLHDRFPGDCYCERQCGFGRRLAQTLRRQGMVLNLDRLRTNIVEFIDLYYNRSRLHSRLWGYRPPEEFEHMAARFDPAGPDHEFFQAIGRSFDPMGGFEEREAGRKRLPGSSSR